MGVAEPPGRDAADERVLGLVHEAGEGRSEQRNVDPLTLAGDRGPSALAPDQRGQDGDRPEHPAHDIADRDADLGRFATVLVRRAGDRHEPARGLDHEVIAGPFRGGAGRPVARDGQVDEARVQPSQRLIVEAEPREPADPEVLDQDVAALEQAVQDGDAVGLLEVEPDAALVPIDREVVGRGPGLARASRPGRPTAVPSRASRRRRAARP